MAQGDHKRQDVRQRMRALRAARAAAAQASAGEEGAPSPRSCATRGRGLAGVGPSPAHPRPTPRPTVPPAPAEDTAVPPVRARTQATFYVPPDPALARRERRGCARCCCAHPERAPPAAPAATGTWTGAALRVPVAEPFCGVGGARSAVRYLNDHRRNRAGGEHEFSVAWALDCDPAKTQLYNATVRAGEKRARAARVEAEPALEHARKSRAPLLFVCGAPCWDLSRLGSGAGVVAGPTAPAYDGLLACVKESRAPLLLLENVEDLLFKPHAASLRSITSRLERLGYHWRACVLDSAKHGSAQQRRRAFLVCALDAAVLDVFLWPKPTHLRRVATLGEALLPVGSAPRSLRLNPRTKVARALSRPAAEGGLRRPADGAAYSGVASVFGGVVHTLKRARCATPTITASRSSGLYLWEGDKLRRLAGVEALRLFTFAESEVEEFGAAARELGVSSARLAEMAGDSFVVIVVARLMRALVDAFAAAASDEARAPWVVRGG